MESLQTANPPNAETIWAILREVSRKQEELTESQKETERIMKETQQIMKENAREQVERKKEIDLQMQETDKQTKETYRQMLETDKRLGKLGNRFGEMVEALVKPCLVDKFQELGFVFTKVYPNTTIKDEKNNFIAEVDITLENGDKVMIVEAKLKPNTYDITDHIERMEKVRAHANQHNDNRKYLGAIAGMVISDSEKIFALKNGFYVIEPSGESFNITAPEGIYSPREW